MHSYTLQVARDGTEGWSDLDSVHTSAVRLLAEELGYNNTVRFRVRACNTAGLCTTSEASRSVVRVNQPPSAGAVTLRLGEAASFQGYMPVNNILLVAWDGFVAAGCPFFCGAHGEKCAHDFRCSDATLAASTIGCNARGVGQSCRFCGFGVYPPCPDGEANTKSAAPDPLSLSEPGLGFTTELCIGTTRYGCDAVHIPTASSAANGSWSSTSLPLRQCRICHLPNMAASP